MMTMSVRKCADGGSVQRVESGRAIEDCQPVLYIVMRVETDRCVDADAMQ
jgi:hypothetical protein